MTSPPQVLKDALADRYDLEREIGRGGMATVFLATDVRHRRQVAVKVMREDLTETLGAERFLQEIDIAAKLNHPHILPLLDSANFNGVLLYVMPYVRGGSIRDLIQAGNIARERTVELIGQVASALDYAHRNDVVHRDIKPENILLSDGHAVVGDFGIAKAVSTLGGKELTRTGFPIGTPGYMSPEQAAGMTSLDGRTDVYSLACVMYEMLIGDTPGFWLTEEASRMLRFLDVPLEHRAILDRLPGSFEQALVRALALRPGDRFETPTEFVQALKGAGGPGKRRYSDTEVGAIVREAAEQEASDDKMTLGGVQQIAAEVGLVPEQIESAARAIKRRSEPSKHWFYGSGTNIRIEETISGEISTDEFPLLVEEIRRDIGEVGSIDRLGKSMTWQSNPKSHARREIHVTITPRNGKTRLRIEERLHNKASEYFGGGFAGVGFGMGTATLAVIAAAANAPGIGAVAAVSVLAASYGGTRVMYKSMYRRHEEELGRLMETLIEIAHDSFS